MGASKNRATPKWMLYNGNPIQMDDLGAPLFYSQITQRSTSHNFQPWKDPFEKTHPIQFHPQLSLWKASTHNHQHHALAFFRCLFPCSRAVCEGSPSWLMSTTEPLNMEGNDRFRQKTWHESIFTWSYVKSQEGNDAEWFGCHYFSWWLNQLVWKIWYV